MNRYVERGWRPLVGALAIGLAAFGLSLQGAPAGDGTDLLGARGAQSADTAAALGGQGATTEDTPEAQRQRKMAPTAGLNQQNTDPTAVDTIGEDTPMHVGRVIGGVPVVSKGGSAATSRAAGAIPLGGECFCDEDCIEADGDQCNLVQCIIRSTCTGTAPENAPCSSDGDCTDNGLCDTTAGSFVQRCDTVQLIGWACDAGDADFCTLDRCADDGLSANHSICLTTDTGAGGSLTPCAKQCIGGPAAGLNCARSSDCAQGSCQIILGGACDAGTESCYFGPSLALAVGRCCTGGACTETDETACLGEWYRYRSSEEQVGDGNCLCPKYGSGVVPGGDDLGSIGLVRPSGLICETGSVVTDVEVYCETAGVDGKFCQKRCVGGDNIGAPCTVDNPDCGRLGLCTIGNTICLVNLEGSDCGLCSISGVGCDADGFFLCPDPNDVCEFTGTQGCPPSNPGTCLDDTCGPNTTEQSCEDGFLNIGDDYSLANGSFLRLTQFRFRGGVTNLAEDIVFEIWNDAGTKLIDAFAVPNLGRTGTHDWSIEIDCFPNCDPTQLEVPEQNPIIIPPTGHIVMRSTRTVGTINGAAAFWEQTDNPADVGDNDATRSWVNGDRDGTQGTNVYIFELLGVKVPEPLGACCDDALSCEDTLRWDCGICSQSEPQVLCASTLHDCPDALGLNSICQFNRWFGPISHDDFQGLGTDLTLCFGPNSLAPCDSGACCDGETCSIKTPDDCENDGGAFQGIATDCSPNCCPVGAPTGSDCICSTSTCVEIALSCLGGADDGADCTVSADCAITDPLDTGVCGNFNTGNLCTADADCTAVAGTCVLQCEANATTQLRHPFECIDDFGSPREPRVDCDPANGTADCPAGDTCEQSFTGVYSVTRNDSIVGDLFTAAEGERCSINTTNDRTGWYEKINLPDPTPGDGSDDCYILTVGLCCTEPILTPIWPFLSSYRNCPCSETADVIGTSPDFDLSLDQLDGFGANSKASIAGRCEDGNYSATFTVPPGEYAYQINADTACSGSIIGCDDADDCPGSSCNVPNPNYSVVFTVESCQIAACCVDDGCIETNKLDCRAKDGNFLGEGDQPVVTCQVGACGIGACCLDGICKDDEFSNTLVQCEAQDGVYLGGVVCDQDPCPACPFNFPATCQQVQTIFGAIPLIDRNPDRDDDVEEGTVLADDIIFGGSIVDEICWNAGFYTEPCCMAGNCVANIDTTWEIRIYAADPTCDALPGVEIGQSAITVFNKIEGTGQATGTWHYSGTLLDAISLPNGGLAGDTYWFEVSGHGEVGCGIRANWSRDQGNEHFVASQIAAFGGARDYNLNGIGDVDLGFCENSGLASPGPILGSCCSCPANCQEGFTQRECGFIQGVWLACAACAQSPCPGIPANDNCETPFLVSNVPEHDVADMTDPVVSLPLSGENICAGLDGPGLSTDIDTGGCQASLTGTANLFNDIWYKYTATACGDLTIESCGAADMDQMLAVYVATNGCPVTDAEELACGDDTCGIGAGPATVTVRVNQGVEYLIRMGGWNNLEGDGDPRGSFVFNWSLETGVCAAVEDVVRAASPDDILKNRFISIDPRGATQNNPSEMHIRLEVDSTEVIGLTGGTGPWWATDPVNGGGLSPAVCISVVSKAKPAAAPNWTGCTTVHLTGCAIVPTTTYLVQAEASGELSAGALLATQAKPGVKWTGDCVGFFDGNLWTGPNGVTSIDDAVAAIKTFQDPTALNATHLSVTDMVPNLNGTSVNLIVNINDVLDIILGFQGKEYPGIDLTQCP